MDTILLVIPCGLVFARVDSTLNPEYTYIRMQLLPGDLNLSLSGLFQPLLTCFLWFGKLKAVNQQDHQWFRIRLCGKTATVIDLPPKLHRLPRVLYIHTRPGLPAVFLLVVHSRSLPTMVRESWLQSSDSRFSCTSIKYLFLFIKLQSTKRVCQ